MAQAQNLGGPSPCSFHDARWMMQDGHLGQSSLGTFLGQVALDADWHKLGNLGPATVPLYSPQEAGHISLHHVVCLLSVTVPRWSAASWFRLPAACQLLWAGISRSGHWGGWPPAAQHWQSSKAPPIVAAKPQGGQGPKLSPVRPQLRSGVATTSQPRRVFRVG